MDDDHRLAAAEQRSDAAGEVVEGVAVLGEDDEPLARRGDPAVAVLSCRAERW
jgi:hypothetical protein